MSVVVNIEKLDRRFSQTFSPILSVMTGAWSRDSLTEYTELILLLHFFSEQSEDRRGGVEKILVRHDLQLFSASETCLSSEMTFLPVQGFRRTHKHHT